jgi:glutaredoxin
MNQDVREMCVNKYMGVGSWFDFALAMNKQCTAQNADTCWEAVATGLGLDVAKIKKCQTEEALTLAEAELQLDTQLSVRGSPTIFINGKSYSGGRAPADFLSAVCNEFTVKPTECANAVQSTATAAAGNC